MSEKPENEEQEKEVTPEKEEGKSFEIFKEAEYRKPPDEEPPEPPPPIPRSDQEPDEDSDKD